MSRVLPLVLVLALALVSAPAGWAQQEAAEPLPQPAAPSEAPPETPPADVGAADPVAPPEESGAEAETEAAQRLGLDLSGGSPMSISAEELEAMPRDGGVEKVIFRRNVVVEQGPLRIDCDRLEAFYPSGQGGGRPDKITASGSVRITQPGREAHCDVATLDNRARTAVCKARSGKVQLRRGEDVIHADSIEFDLKTGAVRATGGVTIQVAAEEAAK